MSENEDGDFYQTFAFTQGRMLANQFILYELVRTIARQSENPQTFLAGLYDRVCGRTDQMMEPGEKAASVFAREGVDRFFSNLSRSL